MTRDQEAFELRSQLDRLESLLGLLQSNNYEASPPPKGGLGEGGLPYNGKARSTTDFESERNTAVEALGLLSVSRNLVLTPRKYRIAVRVYQTRPCLLIHRRAELLPTDLRVPCHLSPSFAIPLPHPPPVPPPSLQYSTRFPPDPN